MTDIMGHEVCMVVVMVSLPNKRNKSAGLVMLTSDLTIYRPLASAIGSNWAFGFSQAH